MRTHRNSSIQGRFLPETLFLEFIFRPNHDHGLSSLKLICCPTTSVVVTVFLFPQRVCFFFHEGRSLRFWRTLRCYGVSPAIVLLPLSMGWVKILSKNFRSQILSLLEFTRSRSIKSRSVIFGGFLRKGHHGHD